MKLESEETPNYEGGISMKRKVTTVFLSFCILAIINSLTVSAETGIRWSPAPTGPSRHTEPRLPELRRERSMSAFPIRRVPVHVLVDQQWISGDIHRNPFNPNGNPNYRQTTFDIIFAATDVYWQEFSLDIHGSGVITRWHSPNTLDGEVLLANARAHGLAGQRLQIAFSGRRFIQFFDRDNNEWIEIGGLASFRDWGVLVLDFGTHNRAITQHELGHNYGLDNHDETIVCFMGDADRHFGRICASCRNTVNATRTMF